MTRTLLCLEVLEDRIAPAGFQSLYSFTGGDDGREPEGGVIVGSNGSLYGTTELGGASGNGTVFQFISGTTLGTLYSFYGNDNSQPSNFLITDSEGNFYGTTLAGGLGAGTVFELSSNGTTLTTLHTFNGSDGLGPNGNLVMNSKGNLYGTT